MTAEQVADGIVARESKEPRFSNGKPAMSYGVLVPSAFNVVSGPSIAERTSRAAFTSSGPIIRELLTEVRFRGGYGAAAANWK
jgi:hypothetical protein